MSNLPRQTSNPKSKATASIKDLSKARSKPTVEKMEELFSPYDYELEVLRKRYEPLNYTIDMYYKKLKESIIGQDKAIKELLFICYHNQFLNMLEDTCGIKIKHAVGIAIGPSGVGKTASIQKIASFFKVPWIKYNATQLTSAGWVGNDADSIILSLLKEAGDDIELAQRGIIFIDEIDKKVSTEPHGTSGRDVNGTAVQEELLKIMESSVVYIGKDNKPFDTHNLTIILGGRFKGLEEIRKKRLRGKTEIGFGDGPKSIKDKFEDMDIEDNPFFDRTSEDYIDDDLIEFGFIDEFVGRCMPPSEFKKLSVEVIEDIIYSKDSTLQQLLHVFNSRGVDLIIDPMALTKIAEAVANSDTGARKLEGKIFKLLMPALYDVEQNYCPGICEIDENGNYTSVFEDRRTRELKVNDVVHEMANKLNI